MALRGLMSHNNQENKKEGYLMNHHDSSSSDDSPGRLGGGLKYEKAKSEPGTMKLRYALGRRHDCNDA